MDKLAPQAKIHNISVGREKTRLAFRSPVSSSMGYHKTGAKGHLKKTVSSSAIWVVYSGTCNQSPSNTMCMYRVPLIPCACAGAEVLYYNVHVHCPSITMCIRTVHNIDFMQIKKKYLVLKIKV